MLGEALAELEERHPRPLYLVTGMINTKDSLNYFRPFEGLVERVFAVPIRGTEAMRTQGANGQQQLQDQQAEGRHRRAQRQDGRLKPHQRCT